MIFWILYWIFSMDPNINKIFFKSCECLIYLLKKKIAASKIVEQGPVLIVTFTAQQIIYVTDSKGAVVEGEKEKIKRVYHVWALSRDQSILDPNQAWRVMECAMNASEMFV